jgi:hypothetical protein
MTDFSVVPPLGSAVHGGWGIATIEFVHTREGLRPAADHHFQLFPENRVSDADLDCHRAMDSG